MWTRQGSERKNYTLLKWTKKYMQIPHLNVKDEGSNICKWRKENRVLKWEGKNNSLYIWHLLSYTNFLYGKKIELSFALAFNHWHWEILCPALVPKSSSGPRHPWTATPIALYPIVWWAWEGLHPLLLHIGKKWVQCLRLLLRHCIILLSLLLVPLPLLLLLLWPWLQGRYTHQDCWHSIKWLPKLRNT